MEANSDSESQQGAFRGNGLIQHQVWAKAEFGDVIRRLLHGTVGDLSIRRGEKWFAFKARLEAGAKEATV